MSPKMNNVNLLLDENTDILALVIEGYVNGYAIIKELYSCGVPSIGLIYNEKILAKRSNKLTFARHYQKTAQGLLSILNDLHKSYSYIVIYPTSDGDLELLHQIRDQIQHFCYLPFNPDSIEIALDKANQKATCGRLGLSYPKTIFVSKEEELSAISGLEFPVIIKPSHGSGAINNPFRTIICHNKNDISIQYEYFKKIIKQGHVNLLISEFITGKDDQIFIYTCFRSNEGDILNEWVGQKITQCPVGTGVFASVASCHNIDVVENGRLIIDGLDLYGVIEAEFKYDLKDGTYKLMEVTMRPSMPHRIGYLSGVSLHYTQYCYALRKKIPKYHQSTNDNILMVFMHNEIINLLTSKKYYKTFWRNICGKKKIFWAVYDRKDPWPFLASTSQTIKSCLSILWKKLTR